MPIDDLRSDGPLTPEQEAQVALLTDSELAEIDEMLMSKACSRWRKVAYLVGSAMADLPERVPGIPDVFYAQRIRRLVDKRLLESAGSLEYMRYSEVRLPSSSSAEGET